MRYDLGYVWKKLLPYLPQSVAKPHLSLPKQAEASKPQRIWMVICDGLAFARGLPTRQYEELQERTQWAGYDAVG